MAYSYRSAITGEWVSQEYAQANPETTVRVSVSDEMSEQETDSRGDLYHDEFTMKKVHDALKRAGITGVWTRTAIITELQAAGILFRERGKF